MKYYLAELHQEGVWTGINGAVPLSPTQVSLAFGESHQPERRRITHNQRFSNKGVVPKVASKISEIPALRHWLCEVTELLNPLIQKSSQICTNTTRLKTRAKLRQDLITWLLMSGRHNMTDCSNLLVSVTIPHGRSSSQKCTVTFSDPTLLTRQQREPIDRRHANVKTPLLWIHLFVRKSLLLLHACFSWT